MYDFATPRDIFAAKDAGNEMKQTEVMFERLVVSVDDSKEKVVDTIMDTFSIADFKEIQSVIETLIDPKKKSDNPSSTTATNE